MRQGDPLSPFLFMIAAEGLNVMMTEETSQDIFKGIKIGSNEVEISHLQYADDTIIFGEGSTMNAKNLMRIMKCLQEISGLKINMSKSKVFGIGVTYEEVNWLARGMGCVAGKLPFTYLGMPICLNMRSKESWNIIIEKFKNKLSDWKAKTISFGGRSTLVKSVLGGMALYYFSFVSRPDEYHKSVRKSEKNFLLGCGRGKKENGLDKVEQGPKRL